MTAPALGTGSPKAPPQLPAVHPESVPDDVRTLRWAVPAGTLRVLGTPDQLPPALQRLVDEQVLAAVRVEPSAVRTTLAGPHEWRGQGAAVRAALQAGLQTPELWVTPGGRASDDDLLEAAVEQVIAGEVGDYIRSHGGHVRLLRVHDHDIEVQLGGACAHCPAAEATLAERLETAVRALRPDLRHVVARTDDTPQPRGRAPRFLTLRPRSRA